MSIYRKGDLKKTYLPDTKTAEGKINYSTKTKWVFLERDNWKI